MPDSTLEFFQFLAIQNVQKCRYLVVFSTHCGGLALENSLGTFRHKQDLHGCQHDLQVLHKAWVAMYIRSICSLSYGVVLYFPYTCA